MLEEATAEIFSVVQKEGNRDVKRNAKCYNLDAIIAVGYRVNSKKATIDVKYLRAREEYLMSRL